MTCTRGTALALVLLASTGIARNAYGQPTVPTRELREEVRIVSSDAIPGMSLTSIYSATLLPDGRLLTVHYKEGVVRVFDANGKLARVVGHLGDGPGEFRTPSTAGFIGDTIWVRDDGRNVYHLFSASFAPIGQLKIGPGLRYGVSSGSTSLFNRGIAADNRVRVANRDGEEIRALELEFRRSAPMYEANSGTAATPSGSSAPRRYLQPLTTSTSFELLPGGKEGIVLESAEIWGGQAGQVALRRVNIATGAISASATFSLPARRVTASESDSIIAAEMKFRGFPSAMRSVIRTPAYHPAYKNLIMSSDGVLLFEDSVDPLVRTMVDLSGKPLARIRLPRGLRVVGITRTSVWGVLLDQDDLPVILRYRIL